jgi:protease I
MSKKAVIIVGKGFEDSEFTYPFYRLQEEGIKVDVAVAGDAEVAGKLGQTATPTIKCSELNEQDFDMVIIPGGHEGPDRVRQVKEVLNFVKAMDEKQKIIATICHGSWVTISAKIMQGKKATCYKGMKDDLINSGCEYVDEDVVVDGHFISSPHFRNNHQWMKALIEQL